MISHGSSVSKVIWLPGFDSWKRRKFFYLCLDQLWVPSNLVLMVIGGSFSWDKADGAWSWPLTSI